MRQFFFLIIFMFTLVHCSSGQRYVNNDHIYLDAECFIRNYTPIQSDSFTLKVKKIICSDSADYSFCDIQLFKNGKETLSAIISITDYFNSYSTCDERFKKHTKKIVLITDMGITYSQEIIVLDQYGGSVRADSVTRFRQVIDSIVYNLCLQFPALHLREYEVLKKTSECNTCFYFRGEIAVNNIKDSSVLNSCLDRVGELFDSFTGGRIKRISSSITGGDDWFLFHADVEFLY